jgi:hypothetical protein
LDLRIPGQVPFTPEFAQVYSSVSSDEKRWRKSNHYVRVANFEDCGYEMLLHMSCTVTKEPIHKLEVLRAGDKTLSDMRELAGRVFATDPDPLGLMRVDLTADLEGVPVDFFKRHTKVRCKQTRREFGTVEGYQTVAKGTAETLYSGVKPNQIRIYDKTGERRMQYERYLARFQSERDRAGGAGDRAELRKVIDSIRNCAEEHTLKLERIRLAIAEWGGTEPSSFEELYGHGPDEVITRVERQVGARDLDKLGLISLRALRLSAELLNPFEKMVFFENRDPDPRIEDWGFIDWHCGMDLRRRVEMFGIAEVEREMKAQLHKNFHRTRKKFDPFLRLTSNVVGIDSKRLRDAYASSTYRQLLRAA